MLNNVFNLPFIIESIFILSFFFCCWQNDVDESTLSPEEAKERRIMKLLLKIKNGTPPMRKAALRQVTDKAREFGAGPLFNQILPLLMSPTLEDQERHLLVKVIDRILYKLDDLVRPYVHKVRKSSSHAHILGLEPEEFIFIDYLHVQCECPSGSQLYRVAQKNGTGYFPQYVDAVTGISVWGNFSWEKRYQDQLFWFSSLFSRAHFVRQCRGPKCSLFSLTLKGPGFFVYLKSGGGADSAPPPQISAAERRKILKFGTYVEFINTHVLTKLQCWKSNCFLIMQIYVNYMHVLLFFIITDKMRPFRAFKMFWYCHRNI